MGTHRHGTETFFIDGEGLVETDVGRRSAQTRALARAEAPPFRFFRAGPRGRRAADSLNRKLALAMVAGGGGAGDVPAGYTYLGQFIDHDLTLDQTLVRLGEDVTPAELVQGRSPRLDLDSLYGAGPADPVSAAFYEADGLHLRTGDTIEIGADGVKAGHDLPRRGTGSRRERRTALVPDVRNDENLIVAQTHLAMIRFHNRVVDTLGAGVAPAARFRRARKRVTLHYQWMIRHDYLPRLLDPAVVDDVFTHGRAVVEPDAAPTDVPRMPVEFSVAAFRLGHSMVRASYNWNRRFAGPNGFLDYMFQFSATGGDLGGEDRLLSNWIADWRRMYDFPAGGHPELAAPNDNVSRAMRLDTLLTDPLKNLPPGTFGGPAGTPFDDVSRNLAFRNLTRSSMLRLASGQQMVEHLAARGVVVPALTRGQVLDGAGGASLAALTAAEKDAVAARTPLWFYVLREAEVNGGRMTGVGARLVAETMHRAMEGSRSSIVRDPSFRPTLGRGDLFEMTDLLHVAFRGRASGINPLGGP
ncbi:peroxidase family protein [Nocardioides sp. 1609]|uniref:peroxidase family protein n=1 Tax=Nocardioides sp. 1609 TaxID=2508327 RepID=UPI00106F9A77|nr:peroxidase family protein [Nocardioides sp. 1609]